MSLDHIIIPIWDNIPDWFQPKPAWDSPVKILVQRDKSVAFPTLKSNGQEDETFLYLTQQSQVSFLDQEDRATAAFIDFDQRNPEVDAPAQSNTNIDAYGELINEFKHLTKVFDMCSTRDCLNKVSDFFKSEIATISGEVLCERFSSETLPQQELMSSCVTGLRKKNHSGTSGKMVN